MNNSDLSLQQLKDLTKTYIQEWVDKGLPEFQAFCNWALQHVLWDHNPSDGEIERATRLGNAGDRGIDAWFIGELEDGSNELHVVQSKDTGVDEAVVTKLVNNFVSLFPATSANTAFKRANEDLAQEARQFQTDYLENPNSIVSVKFTVVTSSIAQSSVRERAEEFGSTVNLALDSGEKRILKSEVQIVDIKDLAGSLGEIRTSIPFSTSVSADHFLENRGSAHGSFDSATIVVDAQVIADLYNKEGIELFRNNPRYYQSKRTAVNKEMLRTLESDAEKTNFYIFNNGLTAICDSYTVSSQPGDAMKFDAPKILNISCENFQIVNGCQTTVTLWNAHRSASGLKNVSVQVKIIESSGSVAPNIARYTNSQNRMKAEDYKANEPVHHQLQNELKAMKLPWFYEYKRGEWSTDYATKASKSPFVDGNDRYGIRRFGVKDLAQSCLSFLGDPRTASDAVASIFNDESNYQKVFPAGITAMQMLLPRVIFMEIESYVNNRPDVYDSSWALYLKHRETYVIGRLLSDLIRPSDINDGYDEYFNREISELLINTLPEWITEFIEATLPDLLQGIHDRADGAHITARQQVRKNDYLPQLYSSLERSFSRDVNNALQLAERSGEPKHSIGILQNFPNHIVLRKF
jgi:hypothetical protein